MLSAHQMPFSISYKFKLHPWWLAGISFRVSLFCHSVSKLSSIQSKDSHGEKTSNEDTGGCLIFRITNKSS